MPKMMRALAALLVASFILAACGGDAASPTATSKPAVAATTAMMAPTNTAMMMAPTAAMTSTAMMGTPMMDMTPMMTGTAMMMATPMMTGTAMMMATPMMTGTAMMGTPMMDMTPMMTGTAMMTMTAMVEATKVPEPTATAIPPQASNPNAKFTIIMWTKEGEPTLSWVNAQAKTFSQKNPDYNIVVINKGVEDIKGQFPNALLARDPQNTPDILWTVSDHVGVFAPGGLVADLDSTDFKASYNDKFIGAAAEAAKYNGKVWGIPLSAGNHLMLMYNKKLISKVPETWSELIAAAKPLTTGSGNQAKYGLVWNFTEAFWLNPFLAGFGGWPLSDPSDATKAKGTLDTPEMVKTLQFLSDLKNKEKILPAEADYNTSDQLFKDGRAAMLINGDWSVSGYLTDSVKANLELGIAPMPKIDATGLYPAPMVAGVYLMIAQPASQDADKMKGIKLFVDYLTSKEVQLDFTKTQNRLPSLTEARNDPVITNNPILAGSIAQLEKGKPQPVVPQMRCVFDAEKPPLQDVLGGKDTPASAAKKMQTSYDNCAKDIQP